MDVGELDLLLHLRVRSTVSVAVVCKHWQRRVKIVQVGCLVFTLIDLFDLLLHVDHRDLELASGLIIEATSLLELND